MSDTLKDEFNAMAASVIKKIFKEIKDLYPSADKIKRLLQPFKDKEITEVLKENGFGLDSKDEYGDTPLLVAAKKEFLNRDTEAKLKVMSLLLDHGASANAKDTDKNSSIHIVWEEETLRNLLIDKGADINSLDSDGKTVLIKSVYQTYRYKFEGILDKGADVNFADSEGNTPLHHAVIAYKGWMFYDGDSLFNKFIEKGANINAQNKNGDTPLMFAVINGRCDINQIIKAGAKLDTKNKKGETALGMAIAKKEYNYVTKLLEAGAKAENVFEDGESYLSFAVRNKYYDITSCLVGVGKVDVNRQDSNGKTSAHIAAEHNSYKELEVLVKDGSARLDIQDKEENTPLHIAVEKGSRESAMVIMTQEIHPDIHAKNKQGKSSFDIATKKDDKDMLRILSGDKIAKSYVKLTKMGYRP